MDLTDQDIREFADIWEKEFGERLTSGQAKIEAQSLLELAWLVVRPLPREAGCSRTPPDPTQP